MKCPLKTLKTPGLGENLEKKSSMCSMEMCLLFKQVCDSLTSAQRRIEAAWTFDFQQSGILTSVDSDEPVNRNSKCCSVSSNRVIEYSSD